MSTREQQLRMEAIRRRLNGERRRDICRDLGRSTRWFDKWWAEFRRNPRSDLSDRSRAPICHSRGTTPEFERMVTTVRQAFEAGSHGLIGPRAIREKLMDLNVSPVPSETTIQRILTRHQLTHRRDVADVYYPWPRAWEVNAVHATDIITKHLQGGAEVQNFHTIDLFTQAVVLTQHADKTSLTAARHVLVCWKKLGFPWLHQFDNEGSFCGGHTHPHILGRIVRLCLWCGVEPIFTPIYDAKRNYQIETFHSLWCQAFWSRQRFVDLAHVQKAIPAFTRWYHHDYHPRCLNGRTPAQMRANLTISTLTPDLRRLIPDRLPVVAGRIHFMRKVDPSGHIEFLNERWLVGSRWIGEYVRATVNTANQSLTISHKTDDTTSWHVLRSRIFRIRETVHDILPPFTRNRARCRDYLPG